MGYILILINHYPPSLAMATIFIAAALGLLANWLRIYILVLIGYHTEMQSSLMNDHETFGWVVFAFILIPAIYFSPMLKPQSTALAIPKKPRLLPLIPLAFGPVLLFISSNNALNSNPLNLDYLAQYQISESHRVGTLLHPGIPLKETKLIAVDGLQIRTDLFINTPKENREEIVPFVRGVTDGATWVLVRGIPNAHNFDIGVYKTVGNTRQIIIARQYVVGTMQTSSYLSAKFLQIIAKANGENYFGLIIAQTNCQNDCANEIAQFTTSLATISARPSAQ